MAQAVHLRKYGEATTIDFELYEVDGVDLRVDATFAAGDVKVMKDEGAEANIGTLPTDEGQGYSLPLTATEMQAARVAIYLVDSATKVWLDKVIYIETYGHASAAHAFDLGTATQSVSVASMGLSTITSGTFAAGAITAAAIAGNAIGASEIADGAITAAKLAADAITEAKIADNAIAAEHIAANAITAAKIATDAITAAKIATDAFTAAKFAANCLAAANFSDNIPVDVKAIDGVTAAADALQKIMELGIHIGDPTSTGTTTTLIDTTLGPDAVTTHVGAIIKFTAGALKGEQAEVTDFDGTDTITFSPAVSANTAAGHNYVLG